VLYVRQPRVLSVDAPTELVQRRPQYLTAPLPRVLRHGSPRVLVVEHD